MGVSQPGALINLCCAMGEYVCTNQEMRRTRCAHTWLKENQVVLSHIPLHNGGRAHIYALVHMHSGGIR